MASERERMQETIKQHVTAYTMEPDALENAMHDNHIYDEERLLSYTPVLLKTGDLERIFFSNSTVAATATKRFGIDRIYGGWLNDFVPITLPDDAPEHEREAAFDEAQIKLDSIEELMIDGESYITVPRAAAEHYGLTFQEIGSVEKSVQTTAMEYPFTMPTNIAPLAPDAIEVSHKDAPPVTYRIDPKQTVTTGTVTVTPSIAEGRSRP